MTATLARIDAPPQSNALSRFQPQNLAQAMEVAETLSRSGLLPDHLRGKPADVLATMLAGAELGLGMMQSFRALYIIKGKLGFYADFLQAKARQHPDCLRFEMMESTGLVATFVTERRGQAETRLSFTLQEAQAAGLTRNDGYAKQPAAMLRARCISALCRLVYPDTMFGTYSNEELADMEATEKELNPPPQSSAPLVLQPTNPPASKHTGVKGAVAAMRARQANKAPAIVDVAPGETGEEAQAKASGPCLESPGKSAGILVASLSDGELLDVAASAEKYLSDYPNGKHSAVIRKDMLTVSAELDRRAPQENS